jgi:predicted nuclease with TOPRIM domain
MDENEKLPRQQIEARLAALKSEYEKGQARIQQIEGELTSLRETMLRISGAILVLQELLGPPPSAKPREETPDSDRTQTASAFAPGDKG